MNCTANKSDMDNCVCDIVLQIAEAQDKVAQKPPL